MTKIKLRPISSKEDSARLLTTCTTRTVPLPVMLSRYDAQAVVFSGLRFEVENSASIFFSSDAPVKFTGLANLVRERVVSIVSLFPCHCLDSFEHFLPG